MGVFMNKKNLRCFFLFLCLLLICCSACTVKESENKINELNIVLWNVQNLFDGNDNETKYNEYRSSSGWSDEKYKARLQSIAQAIEKMSEESPDIIGLVEVENLQVLEDISQIYLSKYKYLHTFFGKNPDAPLGIGFLSKFPFEDVKLHSITNNGETVPRPILEVKLYIEEKPLVFFICHWKSKREGDDKTETLRRNSARIIIRRIQELQEEDPNIPIIVMGDLNENHDEFFRRGNSVVTALMPDDPIALDRAGLQKDFLVLSYKKPPLPEYFQENTITFYSPWYHGSGGSYNYKDNWETIDHFLLSADLFKEIGWSFKSFKVMDEEPFVNNDGYPHSYNVRTGSGLSDHLPLLLTLELNDS